MSLNMDGLFYTFSFNSTVVVPCGMPKHSALTSSYLSLSSVVSAVCPLLSVGVAHVQQVWTSVSVCLFVLLLRFCSGLSPDLQSMEQIRRIMRPTDVPDQGLLCDLLWSDPDKDVLGWGENDRGVSFTFGSEVVAKFLHKHDLDLICRAHQVIKHVYKQRLFVTHVGRLLDMQITSI